MWISCVSSKRWFCSLWLTVLDHWFSHCSHVACHWLVMGRRPLALRGEFTFSQPMNFSKWKIHGEGSNSNKFDCSRVSLSWIHSWCSSQLKETAVWSRCWFFQGVPLLSFPTSWHTGNALNRLRWACHSEHSISFCTREQKMCCKIIVWKRHFEAILESDVNMHHIIYSLEPS